MKQSETQVKQTMTIGNNQLCVLIEDVYENNNYGHYFIERIGTIKVLKRVLWVKYWATIKVYRNYIFEHRNIVNANIYRYIDKLKRSCNENEF